MNTKQQINLKFLIKLGKTPTQILEILQKMYGGNTMSFTCVFEWYKRLKEACKEMRDDFRNWRPSISKTENKIEWVRQMMCGYHELTVEMIASRLDMKKDSVWTIITEDLGMWKVSTKMVPRQLNNGEKEDHMQVCQDIIKHLQTEPDLLHKDHQEVCNNGAEKHLRRILPAVHTSVQRRMGK